MKIAIADNCSLKFSKDIKEHWEQTGHEVRYEPGASEFLAQWADLYYIDWWDNNIHYLWKFYTDQLPDYPNGSTCKKPKIVVRAFDWDIWVRGIRSQKMVDFVDYIICIAPHMYEWLLKEKDDATGLPIQWGDKLHLIRPGVNLDKFSLKKKQTDGFQIGMVLGDMWWYKNHMGGLDIFTTLTKKNPKWRLHIRGQHEPGQYNPVMYEAYLDSRRIRDKVTLYSSVDNMNDFYEDIDILLHPGMKETFCYAVGEALAKGIPAVVNNFYGATDIWDPKYLYNTHAGAVYLIEEKLKEMDRGEHREYIRANYDVYDMLRDYDELFKV